MKTSPAHLKSRTSQGFSLIELMVSLTIGLVVVVAALSAYMGAASATKMASAQSVMNEDGQSALGILSQHIRMAGYTSKTAAVDTVRGCEGTFTNIKLGSVGMGGLNCTNGNTTSDSIAVFYEADAFNTIATSAGKPTDCLGNSLKADADDLYWAENRFFIDTMTGTTTKSLYCKGNAVANNGDTIDNNHQPLVENVEDLQLTYGSEKDAGDKTVAGYVSASDVTNWAKILTVRICVVVRSEQPVLSDAKSAYYKNCAGTTVTPGDLYMRRTYQTTVVLRSKLL
ncbi:MAG: pilus assembly protein PilW [Comamonadaceae bacterium CG12_big_fil_rev_8_21_14_0_65_59_15]|nr:MAG: pilus assembly protein PilW [Comamonadaceae bacterium CG12_big_fil_rev_8_21_14_0_65_59_15]